MPTKAKSCIVIGAGLSGMAAALRLIDRGWKVHVFEVLPWFGGRVYTYRFDQATDLNCELGDEWIGEHHDHMRKLCAQFNLPLQRHRYAFAFLTDSRPTQFYPAGNSPFSQKNRRSLDKFLRQFGNPKLYDECKQKQLDRYDWWTWLAKLGFDHSELLRRDLMDSTDFGESIQLTSAYIAAGEYYASNNYDEMDWKIEGGNHQLLEAMKERLTSSGMGKLHLGKRITEVTQRDSGVLVKGNSLLPTHNGQLDWTARPTISYEADFCICAVPARTINSITWNPPLPADHTTAADELQYCSLVKTVFLYETKFWKKSKFHPFGEAIRGLQTAFLTSASTPRKVKTKTPAGFCAVTLPETKRTTWLARRSISCNSGSRRTSRTLAD